MLRNDLLERQPLLSNGDGFHENHIQRNQNDKFLDDLNKSLEDIHQSVQRQEITAIEMRCGLTPVRRMFCLLALFDFLLMFLLWIIYAQLSDNADIAKRFEIEVESYTFSESLFDFVVVAMIRCVCLLSVYALLRSSKWYMVAITTMLTTLLTIGKVLFIGKHIKTGQPISYFIIIATFIICWAEAWHFDFQVMPSEMKMRKDELTNTLSGSLPTLPTTVSAWRQGPLSEYQSCYSPRALTPRGSDTSSNYDEEAGFSFENENTKAKKRANLKKGKDAVHELLRMIYISENWQKEKHEKDEILVDGRTFKNIGKVFRCTASMDCPPKVLFGILWTDVESQPSWNPTVAECRIVQVINKRTGICYVVAAEAAGGLVSTRDFVSLRRYEKKGDMILLAGIAVECEDLPPRSGIVRGENGPGGYVIKSIPGNPEKCEFSWFLNSNLKGWIPQKIIDQSLATVMVDTVRALRQHFAAMP